MALHLSFRAAVVSRNTVVIAPVAVIGVGCAAVTICVLVTSVMVESYKEKKVNNCDSFSSEKSQGIIGTTEHNLRLRVKKNVRRLRTEERNVQENILVCSG